MCFSKLRLTSSNAMKRGHAQCPKTRNLWLSKLVLRGGSRTAEAHGARGEGVRVEREVHGHRGEAPGALGGLRDRGAGGAALCRGKLRAFGRVFEDVKTVGSSFEYAQLFTDMYGAQGVLGSGSCS